MIQSEFWRGKKVFITGHTGFKGTWLSLWLYSMGAKITGYSLEAPTKPSLFELTHIGSKINSIIADIRDINSLENAMFNADPDIVIHMAAQPLVRASYLDPVETYSTNIMGTVNLFESIRKCQHVKAVLNVTTDKCYENNEWVWGYRESEKLGGYDPYSNSKACSELITSSYRSSFFNPILYSDHGVAIASARAGNVIGGGDWAENRLIPDCIKSILEKKTITLRNPSSIRPWQHVLEPLSGYILLVQKLFDEGPDFGDAWNFGPNDGDAKPVEWIVKRICEAWGTEAKYELDPNPSPHEANTLKLDCAKANMKLNWHPRWSIVTALEKIVHWTQSYQAGNDISQTCLQQINEYMNGVEKNEDERVYA